MYVWGLLVLRREALVVAQGFKRSTAKPMWFRGQATKSVNRLNNPTLDVFTLLYQQMEDVRHSRLLSANLAPICCTCIYAGRQHEQYGR